MELLNIGVWIIAGCIIGLLATIVSDLKKKNKHLIEIMKCCDNCELDGDLDKCPKHNYHTTSWRMDRNLCSTWKLKELSYKKKVEEKL